MSETKDDLHGYCFKIAGECNAILQRDDLCQQVATLQKDNDSIKRISDGRAKQRDDVMVRNSELQKDNDTLAEDLTEAEGAVADLMELNDSLKAEVERVKAYPTEEAYLAVCEARTNWMERAEKAEAERDQMKTDSVAGWRSCIDHIIKPESSCPVCEVERLRVALETIGHECGNDLSGAAKEFIKQALNHKEK